MGKKGQGQMNRLRCFLGVAPGTHGLGCRCHSCRSRQGSRNRVARMGPRRGWIGIWACLLVLNFIRRRPEYSREGGPRLGCSKSILTRMKEIEDEMASTQKNKATEHHIGRLKGRLAALRSELIAPKGPGKGAYERTFEAARSGDARVALIGFPSVGKSTFLTNVTNTTSKVAGYKHAEIQILDLPGIIEGAATGIGRGKQVIASARTADLIILFMDAGRADEQKEMLEHELEMMGIRLNQEAPDVNVIKHNCGGIQFTSTFNLEGFNKELAIDILHDQKIRNAEVQLREKDLTIDRFIDAVSGNVKYIPALYICNKIDKVGYSRFRKLAQKPNYVLISCHRNWNMNGAREAIYQALHPIRVYTKRPKKQPSLDEPVVLCKGRHKVADLCRSIHSSLADPTRFYYANVWGTSVKFRPQRVGLSHTLQDEDVVQIMLRKSELQSGGSAARSQS
ncbi:hypothetical protein AAMO2058_001491500 [Amorphochlora amoebiformis]